MNCKFCDKESGKRMYCNDNCRIKFYYRKKQRERVIANGGPRLCEICKVGEVWKDYAKYCCKECREEANRIKQRERSKTYVRPVKKKEERPKRPMYHRAKSLADLER